MVRFLSLLARFRRDDSGMFAVIFGLMAVVLVAFGGAVVDYVGMEQNRSRAQVALDAATLALQKQMLAGVSDASIKTQAQALLTDRVGDPKVTALVTIVRSDKVQGSLEIEADITAPTMFVALVGVPSLKAKIISESIRRKSELEVVMVLDNSGSMNDFYQNLNQYRMTSLVNAAKSATQILFASSSATDPNVKMAIVPFTQYVNIGIGNASQTWLNRSGANLIVRDNFDDDANPATDFIATNPVFDRIAQFGKLAGGYVWGGCVEARQTPYDTNDTAPTTAITKFVPLFVPDEPDSGGFNNSYLTDTPAICTAAEPSCTVVQKYSTYSFGTFSGLITTTYNFKSASGTTSSNTSNCPASYNTWVATGSSVNDTSAKTRTTTYYSNRVRQERICKYTGGIVTKASRSSATGPNADCPANAILPLTYTQATVLATIEKMRPVGTSNQPEGGTNIAQGAIWGLHVLSASEPFAEGDAYSSNVKKVMILMTDGDNFHSPSSTMNGSTFFPAYGYPYNNTRVNAGRLGQPGWDEDQLRAEMDARTLASCASAKASDVEIFTIGLYSTTPETIQMLKDCSSGDDHYYPATASNLSQVFQSIARQLQPLRISQ